MHVQFRASSSVSWPFGMWRIARELWYRTSIPFTHGSDWSPRGFSRCSSLLDSLGMEIENETFIVKCFKKYKTNTNFFVKFTIASKKREEMIIFFINSFLILLCCENATYKFRSTMVPIHASVGIATFMLAVACCITGLTQKALDLGWDCATTSYKIYC